MRRDVGQLRAHGVGTKHRAGKRPEAARVRHSHGQTAVLDAGHRRLNDRQFNTQQRREKHSPIIARIAPLDDTDSPEKRGERRIQARISPSETGFVSLPSEVRELFLPKQTLWLLISGRGSEAPDRSEAAPFHTREVREVFRGLERILESREANSVTMVPEAREFTRVDLDIQV